MSKFAVRRGHQRTGRDGCASGYVNEITVADRYYRLVMSKLKALGHEVLDVTPPEANRILSDSLNYGINMANNWHADYLISCHVNAFEIDQARGCEVICGSQAGIILGQRIVNELMAIGFPSHRGAYLDDRGLAEMREFNGITLICEPFFCDSSADVAVYNSVGDEDIANAIVKGLTGKTIYNINVIKNGWESVNGIWYYYKDGIMVKKGWAKDSNGKWFALGDNGAMIINGWAQDSSKRWFYLGSTGEMVVNGWAQDTHGWCYLGSDGAWDGVYHATKGMS